MDATEYCHWWRRWCLSTYDWLGRCYFRNIDGKRFNVFVNISMDPTTFLGSSSFMRGDYEIARVPMLTVTHGRRSTRNHIFFYTIVLAVFALFTSITSLGGWVYLGTAIVLNAMFRHDGLQDLGQR